MYELCEVGPSTWYIDCSSKIGICKEPKSFDAILQNIFSNYGLTMNFEQYVLVGSTVRSYLSWMKEHNLLEACFEDNRLIWRSC